MPTDPRFLAAHTREVFSGNELLVKGCLEVEGGVHLLTGYPGSPVATFFDIGAYIDGGAPYLDWARELRDQRVADGMRDNPDAHCLPMGHMQLHLHPQPRKIIQTEEIVVILYEGNAGIRQIFLDGRRTPDNNPVEWWYGYSWGRWEGDDLVVTTTHMKDTWLDVNGRRRQEGDLADMIWDVPHTIAFLSQLYELLPGDLVFTGTPAGVGAVVTGDRLDGGIDGLGTLSIVVGPSLA